MTRERYDMQLEKYVSLRWIQALLGSLLSFTLLGCGGGTSGTGDLTPSITKVAIVGEIVDPTSGEPVPNVTVTLSQTGDSVASNTEGLFTVQVPKEIKEPQLFFDSATADGQITLDTLPEDALQIRLVIELNPTSASIALTSVEVEVAPTPTPGPTPSQERPLATPTPSVSLQEFTGKLLFQGAAVNNGVVRIDLPALQRTTQADGRFQFNVSPARKSLRLHIRIPQLQGALQTRLTGLPTSSLARISFALDITPRKLGSDLVGAASNDARNFRVSVRLR